MHRDIKPENIFRIPTEASDPKIAAKQYEQILRHTFHLDEKSFPEFATHTLCGAWLPCGGGGVFPPSPPGSYLDCSQKVSNEKLYWNP